MRKKTLTLKMIGIGVALSLLSGCGQKERLKAEPAVEKTFEEVSVHDPSWTAEMATIISLARIWLWQRRMT